MLRAAAATTRAQAAAAATLRWTQVRRPGRATRTRRGRGGAFVSGQIARVDRAEPAGPSRPGIRPLAEADRAPESPAGLSEPSRFFEPGPAVRIRPVAGPEPGLAGRPSRAARPSHSARARASTPREAPAI